MEAAEKVISQSSPGVFIVKTEDLVPSKKQPRKYFPPKEMEALITSIRSVGQRQPIVIRPIGKTGKYEIVTGERRWRACKALGIKEMYAHVSNSDERTVRMEALILNIHNLGHTHMEISDAVSALKGDGWEAQNIAACIGKSVGWVYQYLSLQKLHPDLKALLHPEIADKERLRFGVAVALAKLPYDHQLRVHAETQEQEFGTEKTRMAQKLSAEVSGKRPRRSVAREQDTFLRFVANLSLDTERVLEMNEQVFKALVHSRGKEEIRKILRRVTTCREGLASVEKEIARALRTVE